jgi:hypothetical protein
VSLATDLLEQARYLAHRERKKPKQASLRRAVSTAYYSLFHLLLEEACRQLVSDAGLRCLVSRAFSHADMQKAAKCFASGGTLPVHVSRAYPGSVPAELQRISRAFVVLQEARHLADYDLLKVFDRASALQHIAQVEQAFADWKIVKRNPGARVAVQLFLSSLLLWDRWKK